MSDSFKPGKPGESVILRNDRTGVEQEWVYFTPEYWQTLPQKNVRKLHEPTVERYMNEMKDDLFFPDIAPPICFDAAGNQVDGQHRREACLRSGKSYWMPVARNVQGKRHAVVDTGRSRKMWQNLGIPPSHDHALKVIWRYGNGKDKNRDYHELSQDEYMTAYRRFKREMEEIENIPPPGGTQAYKKAEVLGVAARALKYTPECAGLIKKALEELKSCKPLDGITRAQREAINKMREYLTSHKSNTDQLKEQNTTVLETLFQKIIENEPMTTRVVRNTKKIW